MTLNTSHICEVYRREPYEQFVRLVYSVVEVLVMVPMRRRKPIDELDNRALPPVKENLPLHYCPDCEDET